MSYTLPDEPRGAVRPELAVSGFWPLLTLMLVGPLAGFAWLAFNSWALGCRHAVRHTAIAAIAVPAVGIATVAIVLLAGEFPQGVLHDNTRPFARIALIAVQAAALGLAFWIMMEQGDAAQWRKIFGPRLGSGIVVFAILLALRAGAESYVPGGIALFLLWTGS